jgi:plastocyanin
MTRAMLWWAFVVTLPLWFLGCQPEDGTGGGTGGTVAATGGVAGTGGTATGGMTMGGFPSTGGTSNTGGTGAVTFTITIQNFAFSPTNLDVPPGATVTVVNQDSVLHSVTSESAMGNFSPGGVNGVSFDTGAFTAGQRTFTIPASAPLGTVVPYYCSVHLSNMPQGTVTIQ